MPGTREYHEHLVRQVCEIVQAQRDGLVDEDGIPFGLAAGVVDPAESDPDEMARTEVE